MFNHKNKEDRPELTVTDDEAQFIHSLLVKTFHIKEASFPATCKYCGKDIVMYGINANWTPMSVKHKGRIHKCKEGRKYYKENKHDY